MIRQQLQRNTYHYIQINILLYKNRITVVTLFKFEIRT